MGAFLPFSKQPLPFATYYKLLRLLWITYLRFSVGIINADDSKVIAHFPLIYAASMKNRDAFTSARIPAANAGSSCFAVNASLFHISLFLDAYVYAVDLHPFAYGD